MGESPLVAGVELGGTKCVCLLASGPSDIREEVRIATGAPQQTLAQIQAVLTGWQRGPGFAALGLASFGPLDLEPDSPGFGRVVGTPKPGWDDVPLLGTLRGFGVPTDIDTDVNAAALAEGRWGAARGLNTFTYVTVGTGVGVGTVVGQQTLRGLGHSEAGHQRVPRLAGSLWPGNCPFHGDCVEGLASGPAIRARFGIDPAQLTADHPAWEEVSYSLAMLFHNLVLTVVPERIVVGGGVFGGRGHLLARVRQQLVRSLCGYGHARRISGQVDEFLAPPVLGERSGTLGAIALAQQTLAGQARRAPGARAKPNPDAHS
jgi:fructokinase